MAGKVPEWARQDMRKSAGYGCKPGIKQMGSPFHGAKPQVRHYADGSEGGVKADDEATLKSEGLKASEGDKVGFFERLRMGNIDDPNSEAYRRFGAGRGKTERDFNAAEKQMDQLDAMRKQDAAAPARTASQDAQNDKDTAYVKPAAPAPRAAPAVMDRPRPDENQSTAEMGRLERKNAAYENQSSSESRRLESKNKEIRSSIKSVKPRPGPNWPSERSNWDARYGKTHNHDGTPK